MSGINDRMFIVAMFRTSKAIKLIPNKSPQTSKPLLKCVNRFVFLLFLHRNMIKVIIDMIKKILH